MNVPIPFVLFPWMYHALKEERRGVEEDLGAGSSPDVLKYLSACTKTAALVSVGRSKVNLHNDATAWCAAFVNWCLQQGGYKGTGTTWAKDFLTWKDGFGLHAPIWGCIVVMDRDRGKGHVGFYLGADGDKLVILGGNQAEDWSNNEGVAVNKRSMVNRNARYLWPLMARTAPQHFIVKPRGVTV